MARQTGNQLSILKMKQLGEKIGFPFCVFLVCFPQKLIKIFILIDKSCQKRPPSVDALFFPIFRPTYSHG